MHFWWTRFSFAFSRSTLKSEKSFMYAVNSTNFMQNTHIKEQWVNWNLINEKKVCFFSILMHFLTHVSTLTLMLAFFVIFNRCVAKLSLLSIYFFLFSAFKSFIPLTRLVWSSSLTRNNMNKHLSAFRTMKLF